MFRGMNILMDFWEAMRVRTDFVFVVYLNNVWVCVCVDGMDDGPLMCVKRYLLRSLIFQLNSFGFMGIRVELFAVNKVNVNNWTVDSAWST